MFLPLPATHLQPDPDFAQTSGHRTEFEGWWGRAGLWDWDGSPVLTGACEDLADPGTERALALLAGNGDGAWLRRPQRLGRATSAAFGGARGCASAKDILRKGGPRFLLH